MKLKCNGGLLGGRRWVRRFGFCVSVLFSMWTQGAVNVYLTGVPDYEWEAGCVGTATGNLMGFWDRHGFPGFYTGPTSYGVAPLDSFGAHSGIRSMWASRAGMDGRPEDQPGHADDYFLAFASTAPDPHVTLGRAEHKPDCLGDFTGLNQNKWKNMNGECDGNIDGYAFVYWDASGARRFNFTPGPEAGLPARDVQSGLREWTEVRGYRADVFTQLSAFNTEVPPGQGFSFQDLKSEIDAGYPVVMFLQDFQTKSLRLLGMDRGNPWIHAVLAYGYMIAEDGSQHVRIRDGYAGGDSVFRPWTTNSWWGDSLPLRGVIGYRPRPRIAGLAAANGKLTIRWDGPNSERYNVETGVITELHRYVVEMAPSPAGTEFTPISEPVAGLSVTIPIPETQPAYFRLRLLPPPEEPQYPEDVSDD
ncbi:MAG: hypothetical protein HY735_32655 [Verrucomicrobia bacterium]|nr:hypothetical protein [Verrucomicrobiota bacterium]